jgi:hypothetical protein
MRKVLSVFLFIFCTQTVYSQTSSPTNSDFLEIDRGVFRTKILKNGIILSKSRVFSEFKSSNSFKSNTLYRNSSLFKYSGPLVASGGIYLAYDAIKGTKNSVLENGIEMVYYERPIFQLMAGVLIFTSGISLIEFNNDMVSKAVRLHNQKKNNNTNFKQTKIGFTATGIGIQVGI